MRLGGSEAERELEDELAEDVMALGCVCNCEGGHCWSCCWSCEAGDDGTESERLRARLMLLKPRLRRAGEEGPEDTAGDVEEAGGVDGELLSEKLRKRGMDLECLQDIQRTKKKERERHHTHKGFRNDPLN